MQRRVGDAFLHIHYPNNIRHYRLNLLWIHTLSFALKTVLYFLSNSSRPYKQSCALNSHPLLDSFHQLQHVLCHFYVARIFMQLQPISHSKCCDAFLYALLSNGRDKHNLTHQTHRQAHTYMAYGNGQQTSKYMNTVDCIHCFWLGRVLFLKTTATNVQTLTPPAHEHSTPGVKRLIAL